jgi:hypothetical protein
MRSLPLAFKTYHEENEELARGESPKGYRAMVYKCEKVSTTFTQSFICGSTTEYKWPTFYEVMRGFRQDSEYGTPYFLNVMRSYTSRMSVETDVMAIYVNDRLLLRDRYTLAFNKPQEKAFVKAYHFCPHIRETMDDQDFDRDINTATELAIFHHKNNDSSYLHGFVYKTYRCTFCPTEFVIEVFPPGLFSGYSTPLMQWRPFVLSITRYVDFGALRDPKEIEWRSLTTWHKREEDEWKNLPVCARHEKTNVKREEWPCIDLTHLEPISKRFERELTARPEVMQEDPPPYCVNE